ncbi:MAG: hypothetical protein JWO11_2138 [Nocardioides sp.]|nr:hypothetical protein [Nocardioides sp.]
MAAVRSLVAAVALTATAVTLGVAVRGNGVVHVDAAAPARPGTPLSAYDTASVVVQRSAFCSGLGPDAVAAALGGAPASSSSYGNGQRAGLTPKLKDVAHEFSCSWHGADGAVARAWVFAPPVTPARARDLAAEALAARGCEPVRDAPAYGSPSAAAVCGSRRQLQASYRGLFGDAWLACSIAVPAPGPGRSELVDRTGRWCVEVARAASHLGG